jgi:hypothetical protein
MNRAYSVFEIKSFDEEQRTFEGIASTPTPDRTERCCPHGCQVRVAAHDEVEPRQGRHQGFDRLDYPCHAEREWYPG